MTTDKRHWPRVAARLAALRRFRPAARADVDVRSCSESTVSGPSRRAWRRRILVPNEGVYYLLLGTVAAFAIVGAIWYVSITIRSVSDPRQAEVEREAEAVSQRVAPGPTWPPGLAQVGQRGESAGLTLTVASVSKNRALAGIPARSGRTFLVVDVTLASARQLPTPYAPSGFRARDEDGNEYPGLIPSVGDEHSLRGGDTWIGNPVYGTIAFDVPESARGYVLAFDPGERPPGYETIWVALGG